MSKRILNVDYLGLIEKFQNFDEYRDELVKLEQEREENGLWEYVLKDNSVHAYNGYLSRYPNGQYSEKAKQNLDVLTQLERENAKKEKERLAKIEEERQLEITKDKEVWELVCKKNNIEDYENYLKSYPNGIHREKAQIKINKLIKLEQQKLKDIEDAKERARLEKIEKEKRLALNKDKEAWKVTVNSNKKADYENYLKFYPNGIHREKAQIEIDKFVKKSDRIIKIRFWFIIVFFIVISIIFDVWIFMIGLLGTLLFIILYIMESGRLSFKYYFSSVGVAFLGVGILSFFLSTSASNQIFYGFLVSSIISLLVTWLEYSSKK